MILRLCRAPKTEKRERSHLVERDEGEQAGRWPWRWPSEAAFHAKIET